MKNETSDSSKIWNNGKEMGFLVYGEQNEVLHSLKDIEDRDSRRRKEIKIISMNIRGLGLVSKEYI